MAKRYELSDWKWERIENLFPSSKTGRPPKWDNKTMLNAILWLARSGSAWEDIPNRYPPHQSVYSRFCKWRDDGTLEAVFHALNADADLENLMVIMTLWQDSGISMQNMWIIISNLFLWIPEWE